MIQPAGPPVRNNDDVLPTGVSHDVALATSNNDDSRIDGPAGIRGEASSAAALAIGRELFVELAARELASRQIQESYDQATAAATLLASFIQGDGNQSLSPLLSLFGHQQCDGPSRR